jgi:hypothetical protein
MFTERYFTQEDAQAVQALLSMFLDVGSLVKYVGIYGELGTPGKFAYAVTLQWMKRAYHIGRVAELEKWLGDALDNPTQAQEVMQLLHALTATAGDPHQ